MATNSSANENIEEHARAPPTTFRSILHLDSNEESSESVTIADRETSLQVTTWIQASYIREKDHNVPRKNMFEHYKAYCTANHLTPVNSATFGKLLRNVFPDLKTRRLGVRGQSKYHYCGIRVRGPEDPEPTTVAALAQDINATRPQSHRRSLTNTSIATVSTFASSSSNSTASHSASHGPATPSLSSSDSGLSMFMLPNIPAFRYTHDITEATVAMFTNLYEGHCREIYNLVCSNQLSSIHEVMNAFYQDMPKRCLVLIQNVPEITEAIWKWDCLLYDSIISRFLPSVSHPLRPETVKSLRAYTREVKEYVESSLVHYPTDLVQKKADVARIFSAKFRRQLSLNFAAQSAATVLRHPPSVNAMCHDWNNFDVDGLLDQALWVCDCNTQEIKRLLQSDVYELLNNRPNIENWMAWTSNVIDKFLAVHLPASLNDANQYLVQAKSLLLKWNFYSSLIMKDLTLQQASSFASFHTLRLFLDDYILYLVEENVAQVNLSLMQQHGGENHPVPSSSSGSH